MKIFIILALISLYLGSVGAQIDSEDEDALLDDVLPTVNQAELIQQLKDMFPLPAGGITILSVKTKDKANTKCTHFTNIPAEKVVINIEIDFQSNCNAACQANIKNNLQNSIVNAPKVVLKFKQLNRKKLVLKIKFRCIIEQTTTATTTTTSGVPRVCTFGTCSTCCSIVGDYNASTSCGLICHYTSTGTNTGTCDSTSTFCPGGHINTDNDAGFSTGNPTAGCGSPLNPPTFFFPPNGPCGPGYCCVHIVNAIFDSFFACLVCAGTG